MNSVHTTALQVSLEELRHALATSGDSVWTDAVPAALADVAAAVQEEVRSAEEELKKMGEINPDYRVVPVADRHVEWKRVNLIKLGEMTHQLRNELQQARDRKSDDFAALRQCGHEIANALEEIRRRDDEFVLKTVNSNPGAGD